MLHIPAISVAVLLKVLVGAGATVATGYVIHLSFTIVHKHARENSPDKKVRVKREREGDFIRIILEASGKPAIWLTKKLDEALEELLPREGDVSEI